MYCFFSRTIVILSMAGWASAAEHEFPAGRKINLPEGPLTPVAIAKLIQTQTGTSLDVSALGEKPIAMDGREFTFWQAIERLAERTNSRVMTASGGIGLKPGKSHSPSFIQGPFRFSVREVLARGDIETGKSSYAVILDVTWEPWLLAYRLDGVPKLSSATNDSGKSVLTSSGGSRLLTSGNLASITVRPALSRADKSLSIAGSVTVTVADEMLAFTFTADNPTSVPAQKGVSVAVKKHGMSGADWFAVFDVENPKSNVTVESYESALLRNNSVRLIPPKGMAIPADLIEAVDMRYGFKNLGKRVGPGWKLEYRTPSPLREIVVPFELKNIPLP